MTSATVWHCPVLPGALRMNMKRLLEGMLPRARAIHARCEPSSCPWARCPGRHCPGRQQSPASRFGTKQLTPVSHLAVLDDTVLGQLPRAGKGVQRSLVNFWTLICACNRVAHLRARCAEKAVGVSSLKEVNLSSGFS